MAHRITFLLAPDGFYRKAPTELGGYVTKPESRWVACKAPNAKTWGMAHRRSGGIVSSLLPAGKLTRDQVLCVIAAIEAHTELDFDAFDRIPELTRDMSEAPFFDAAHRPPPGQLAYLKGLAHDALSA